MTDVTAFDADVLICAAAIEHPLGAPVLDLVREGAAGADRFTTDNRKDFSREIDEIDIVYPDMLR